MSGISAKDIIGKLEELAQNAIPELKSAKNLEEIQELRVKFLGKKGALSEILKILKDVDASERPAIGAKANELRDSLETSIREQSSQFELAQVLAQVEKDSIDITLPGKKRNLGAIHPLVQVQNHLLTIFRSLGFSLARGPEAETEFCNFEALNIPKDHPARDMQDSLYIHPGVVLRTHTSSVQIRSMLGQKPPIKIIATGAVYRNDAVDATHSPMFHQMEGLYVDKKVTMGDLKGTLELFARELMGAQTKIRFRPSFFPFTEPSVEVDLSCKFCMGKGCRICKHTGWIEVLGAGMVHPNVYAQVGYEENQYNGFAFGVGIERIAMLFFGIDDIRLFYENDLRFLEQFKG